MKLLLDNNLPVGLVRRLADYPLTVVHVAQQDMERASDTDLWKLALATGDVVVTRDSDFYHCSLASKNPPKIIWVRVGNCTTDFLENLFREHQVEMVRFLADTRERCFVVTGRRQSI